MKYKTNKSGNLEASFSSPISVDNGFSNTYLGEYKSAMELFTEEDGTPTMIEWVVENALEDEMVESIGLMFDGKELIDYDGVFEMPIQAIQLIRKAGYTVPKHFEE